MLKKATYNRKSKNSVFKGFPLIDFLHPNALKMDSVFTHPILQNAIVNHIKGFNAHIPKPSERGETTTDGNTTIGSTSIGSVNTPVAGNDTMANPTTPKPSFEEALNGFLEGLYLGNFTSYKVQPVLTKPPSQYIYEIGLNTDKKTGFIIKNPFDTLVTFGPRDSKYPYGSNEAIPDRISRLPLVSYAKNISDNACSEASFKRFSKGTKPISYSGSTKAAKNDKTKKSAIVCDLNLRVIVDSKNQLQSLSMYGDTLKLHLSKGLVQTVTRTDAGRWIKTGKRLDLDMGKRIITLKKNRLPNWGGSIDLGDVPVSITSSGLVGRLNKVNIGGTLDKPLIIFDKVEILK